MRYIHNKKLTPIAKTLRKNMTPEEKHLWYDYLRSYPVRFLRQKVIEEFIVDFYCRAANLVIELDGSQHYTPGGIIKDNTRTERFEKYELLVVRFPNQLLKDNFQGVCMYIDKLVREKCDPSTAAGGSPPFSKGG